MCVAFFEAPNYYKEKKLPKLLKKCMPHANAIFSSLKDLKEYLRKQICLQKPVNRAIIAKQQPPHREKSGMVKLENFLPKNTKKNNCKSREWND
ncbi:MAG: hypothetical protein ACFE68_04435 [Candidatus Hodarchaeota archaeon]